MDGDPLRTHYDPIRLSWLLVDFQEEDLARRSQGSPRKSGYSAIPATPAEGRRQEGHETPETSSP